MNLQWKKSFKIWYMKILIKILIRTPDGLDLNSDKCRLIEKTFSVSAA